MTIKYFESSRNLRKALNSSVALLSLTCVECLIWLGQMLSENATNIYLSSEFQGQRGAKQCWWFPREFVTRELGLALITNRYLFSFHFSKLSLSPSIAWLS